MTDNHEYIIQEKGDTDWHIPLNDTIRELDREVPIRDKESNLTDYEPKAEATFIATDTGALYSADGATWYLEDFVVSDFEAKDSITFPDGSTVTSPGSGSAVDFEEDGSTVVSNAGAANFVEAGAATVNVTDDGDGSVTVEVSATDTNTERTNEEIEDIVAALVSGGTNITTTYDDANDTYTIDGLSDEQIEDIVGAMAGNNLSYDDGNALLNATDTNLTDEEVQDIVGPFVTGGSNVTVTYDDAGNTLTVSATDTNLTDEEVEDIIGNAVNTGLSYDDANNQINLTSTDVTVAGNTVSLGGSTPVDHADLSNISANDHHAKYTNEESQDAVGTILGTNFTYDDAAPSITLANDTVTVAGNAVALGGTTGIAHADLSSITSDAHHTRYSDEESQDAVGTILGSNFVYDDTTPAINLNSDTVTVAGQTVSLGGSTIINHGDLSNIAADDHHTRYSDEESQDAIGTILGANFTYSDSTPSITLSNDSVTFAGNTVSLGGNSAIGHADLSNIGTDDHHTKYTNEEAQDAVGTIFGSTLTYNDSAPSMNVADGSIDLPQLAEPFNLYNIAAISGVVDIGNNDLVADTNTIWNESNGSLTADINTEFANIDDILIPDKGITDQTTNGKIWREGNDIFAYVNGGEVHFSDIGSGGGAPTDASYVTTQSESGLSNETVVDTYPFTLSTDTDMDLAGTDLTDSSITTTVWDASAGVLNQSVLGGPASSLTSYPLQSGDLDTESFQDEVGSMAGAGLSYDDPNGTLDVTSTGATQVTATNDYTASARDDVWVDTSVNSVNITVTAPPPQKGARFWVDAVNTSGGTVTLEDNGGEDIIINNQNYGGANTPYSFKEGEVIGFMSDGNSWRGGR